MLFTRFNRASSRALDYFSKAFVSRAETCFSNAGTDGWSASRVSGMCLRYKKPLQLAFALPDIFERDFLVHALRRHSRDGAVEWKSMQRTRHSFGENSEPRKLLSHGKALHWAWWLTNGFHVNCLLLGAVDGEKAGCGSSLRWHYHPTVECQCALFDKGWWCIV